MQSNSSIDLSTIVIQRSLDPDNSVPPTRPSIIWRKALEENNLRFEFLALIPFWNAKRHLKITLDSIQNIVDGIILLDDGSEDGSQEIPKQYDKVIEIITKPPKPLLEWNDSQNRYELYLAAEKYCPKWVICIDSDETLDQNIMLFKDEMLCVSQDIKAFAFHVDDYDGDLIARERYGHRMYRYEKDYNFDKKRLHCRLLPLEITLDEIKLVNLRISHLADEDFRKVRFHKYQRTDPNHQCQSSYTHLLQQLCVKPEFSYGDVPIFTDVVDDGLGRSRYVRRINDFNQFFCDQDDFQSTVEFITQNAGKFLGVHNLFRNVKLDAFLIDELCSDRVRANYSFSSDKDVDVSKQEGWLIEEMHHHRDFFITLGKFILINRKGSMEENIVLFEQMILALVQKNVLKIK